MLKKTFAAAFLAAFTTAPALAADAAAYPNRPVRMIVPFQPGGASDFVARNIEPKLAKALGQHLVIENRVGASGYVGIEAASQATPDGHTVLLGNIGTMAINPNYYSKALKPLTFCIR